MRWTDDLLNELRNQGDKLADDYLKKVIDDGEIAVVTKMFKQMDTNGAEPIHELHPAFEEFFHATKKLPPDTDLKRIERGEEAFARFAFPAALVMLTKSLAEGYAAPNLAIVLNMSKNLERHAYRRLLQVLQMLVNVCALKGFEEGGRAVVTAQKLRMLHSGIRHVAHKYLKGYSEKYHVPVNHEDMLGTIMGFSLLVLNGLEILNVKISDQEKEDFYYMWQVYAVMIGIYPEDKPFSFDYIPATVADAKAFYKEYARRHYTGPEMNPDGVQLTRANIRMLKELVPWWLKLLGFGLAPRVYTYHLLGKEAAQRVGVKRLPGHHLFKSFFFMVPKLVYSVNGLFSRGHSYSNSHHYLAELLFEKMINAKFGHEITFTVPDSLKKVKEMVLE